MRNILLIAAAVLAACSSALVETASDPLPSWNDGSVRDAIVTFVQAANDRTSDNFIPPEERVAVFDNDGTLWAEKPLYFQVYFALDRVKELAAEHPEWKTEQPFQAVLEGDQAYLAHLEIRDAMKLLGGTHTGITQEEFREAARAWLSQARHPDRDRLFTELVYQPQLELLDYFRQNGFKVFIVTGGGIDFVRGFSSGVYGIPPEKVVGSSPKFVFQPGLGGSNVVREAELGSFNDKEAKPANIELHIGQRPAVAVGNSDGDLAMMTYTADREGPSLSVLVHHDDDEREYSYTRGTEDALRVANERGWTVVSMRSDWNRIFPSE